MYIFFRINNIFTGLDWLPTGPRPQKTAGSVLYGLSPVFWTIRIYQNRSRSRSLLAGAKNQTRPDFQTLEGGHFFANHPTLPCSKCKTEGGHFFANHPTLSLAWSAWQRGDISSPTTPLSCSKRKTKGGCFWVWVSSVQYPWQFLVRWKTQVPSLNMRNSRILSSYIVIHSFTSLLKQNFRKKEFFKELNSLIKKILKSKEFSSIY